MDKNNPLSKLLSSVRGKLSIIIDDKIPEVDSRMPIAPIEGQSGNKPLINETAVVSIYDRFSSYPSVKLTPEKLAAIIREDDSGDNYRLSELFEEILQKDGRILSDHGKIRSAITRRNYNILAVNSDDPKQKAIRDDVDAVIKKIRGWKNVVANIVDAYFKEYSVNEMFWLPSSNKYTIADVRWRHQKRFRYGKTTDPYSDPDDLRLLVDSRHIDLYRNLVTPEDLNECVVSGLSLNKYPLLRSRFIVAHYRASSAHGHKGALMRPLTYIWMFKNFDVKFWVQFLEIQLGYRVGKYDVNQPDQKALLEQAIAGLATDAAAVISKDSTIEFIEMLQKAASHLAYKDFREAMNAEISELILGNEGSTRSTPGRLGGENQAQEVKQEIVEGIATVVDEAITDDLIKNYVDFNYGPQDAYPYYQTDISQALDMTKEVEIGIGLQQMGAKFQAKTIKEKFGWPLANDDEDILVPMPKGGETLPPSDSSTVTAKKKLLSRR